MLLKNSYVKTPPMGWNSYDYYDTTVNEEQVRANAEYMAKYLRPYGYEYVVIDIQWSDPNAGSKRDEFQYINFSHFNMDEYSRQLPAENRFPSSKNGLGFGPLADYIHSLGLKLGIHIMRGIPRYAAHMHLKIKDTELTADQIADPYSISKWNPDMYGVNYKMKGAEEYYNSIFQLYAEWGIDFVKVDDICNTNMYPENPYSAEKEIELIHNAIANCGRNIVLSLSPGPAVIEKAWHLEKYSNMWRITDDFWDNWNLLKNMFFRCEVWQKHVSEGCYPDCDMLPIGWLGKGFGHERYTNFTYDEQITLMTLWCIFRSPLMIGAELTKLDEKTLALLTNHEVLHLVTGAHGAEQIEKDESHAVWRSKDDNDGSDYVALFNLSDETKALNISLEALGIKEDVIVRDLWKHKDLGALNELPAMYIPAHGALLYKLSKAI
ncbi:glycoside hydrolase family 27 protein [Clostridium sp. 19966]|uniref:glycoside hydrolase family 27 protein n=1 Tax=Clostridium sp. 19966 TaxID=2768166 RepID=UPI0028DDCD68|nr:glycoside hydrolase family 27 protein [Clostridium sp. 19966]MDT8717793.1 glycoside hydrolase family 27 protein [Clostridium sp. 19966]